MTLSVVQPLDFASLPHIPTREPGRMPSDVRESTGAQSTRPSLLDDVQVMALPDPEWLIEGLIPRRAIVGLYGPPGTYKTTLDASLQVSLATGQDWYGHKVTHRGASIYVGAEDVSGFKIRLAAAKRAARLSLSQSVGIYTFPDAIDLRDPVNVGRFVKLAQESGGAFVLVTIDTFAASTPGSNENSSEDMTAAITSAQLLRDQLDATVLLIHHTNASGSRERGHSAMRGSADTMISITPSDDSVLVECSKQRNASPFPTLELKAVQVPEGGCVLRLAAAVLPSTGLTHMQGKALDALREAAGADGITKAQWRVICHDMTERSFYKVAKSLEERRLVVKVGTTHFRAGSAK